MRIPKMPATAWLAMMSAYVARLSDEERAVASVGSASQ
jgi:hypothetical protein